MERKYDEKFEFVNIGTELIGASYIEMHVTSEKLPGEFITVHMDRKDKSCSDNYIMYLMHEKFLEFMQSLAEEIYEECQVFTPVPTRNGALMPEHITKGISLDDYLKTVNRIMHYFIYTNKDVLTKDEDLEKLRMALEKFELISGVASDM